MMTSSYFSIAVAIFLLTISPWCLFNSFSCPISVTLLISLASSSPFIFPSLAQLSNRFEKNINKPLKWARGNGSFYIYTIFFLLILEVLGHVYPSEPGQTIQIGRAYPSKYKILIIHNYVVEIMKSYYQ